LSFWSSKIQPGASRFFLAENAIPARTNRKKGSCGEIENSHLALLPNPTYQHHAITPPPERRLRSPSLHRPRRIASPLPPCAASQPTGRAARWPRPCAAQRPDQQRRRLTLRRHVIQPPRWGRRRWRPPWRGPCPRRPRARRQCHSTPSTPRCRLCAAFFDSSV
jgi:hypothetical protein